MSFPTWGTQGWFKTYLQPVNRTLDISYPEEKPISLRQADGRRSELPAPLIPRVHSLERLGPSLGNARRGRASKAQADQGGNPLIIDDEIGSRRRRRPLRQEGLRKGDGIPGE